MLPVTDGYQKGRFSMKKKILTGIVLALCLSLLFSCFSAPPPVSYLDANAGSGSTLIIGQSVIVDTFDGVKVGWRGTQGLMGFQAATIYIPSGLHSFTVSAGFLNRQYDISFTPGKRYIIAINLNKTAFIFEEQ